jgi:hypothetical protein
MHPASADGIWGPEHVLRNWMGALIAFRWWRPGRWRLLGHILIIDHPREMLTSAHAAVTVVDIDPEMPRSGRAANALASLRSNSLGLRSGWSSAAVVLGRR